MNHAVPLPALDGRDVLGFLAALGLLRLLNEEAGIPARLAFRDTDAVATLHSELTTVDDIVGAVVQVVNSIPDGGVIPGVPADFPPGKEGIGKDPMRMPRDQLRAAVESLPPGQAGHTLRRWWSALVTDLAVDTEGRVALTPFMAPAGQQSVRSFFTKPLTEVRKDTTRLITEALTRWRRVDGYTGEYLDHRVLRSAADHPTGNSVEAGVPGATWLAIMALPILRLTTTSNRVQATLWHTITDRRQPIMTWPLWRQPLDIHSVTALIEHPDLRPNAANGNITVDTSHWTPLDVFTIAAAARQLVDGRKSAGVLAPLTIRHT